MNIILGLLLFYLFFLVANNEINKYIVNKIDNEVANYMAENHIELDGREELIVETLVTHFCQELISSPDLEYFPFISIWKVLKNAFTLDEEIEGFIFFLNNCYSDIMGKVTKRKSLEEFKPQNHFISYKLDGKLVTIIFTFNGSEVNIVEVSDSLKNKNESELYQDLLDALALINRGSQEFNHSKDLVESYQSSLSLAQEQDKGRIRKNKNISL